MDILCITKHLTEISLFGNNVFCCELVKNLNWLVDWREEGSVISKDKDTLISVSDPVNKKRDPDPDPGREKKLIRIPDPANNTSHF